MSSGVPPAANGLGQYFDRMLRAMERSVKVQTRLLIQGKHNGAKIDRLTEAIGAQAAASDEGRDAAVEQVKAHVGQVVKLELATSTRWERRFLIIVGILIILSNLLGQPIGVFLEKAFHIAR